MVGIVAFVRGRRRRERLRYGAFGQVPGTLWVRGTEIWKWVRNVKHRRNTVRSYQHFVWTTRDRLPLVTEDIERAVYRYIETVCGSVGCAVLAIGGMPDHVHLLVAFPTTLTYANLINRAKGGSSRLVTETLRPGEWFAWRENYAVFSVSPRDKKATIAYINNQKKHHAANKLWPSVETLDDEENGDDADTI